MYTSTTQDPRPIAQLTSGSTTTSAASSPPSTPPTDHHHHPLLFHYSKRSTRGDWSLAQDEALRVAVNSHGGKNWKRIAEDIPGGKTHVQCLQRWNKVIKPGLVKGPWKQYEDELLRQSVSEISSHNWVSVSERVPGRTPKQCRERWLLCLDPKIKKEKWSPEEDEELLKLHGEHGNSWAFLATHLPGRTENAIKSRIKSLTKREIREENPAMTPKRGRSSETSNVPLCLGAPVKAPLAAPQEHVATTVIPHSFPYHVMIHPNTPPPPPQQSTSFTQQPPRPQSTSLSTSFDDYKWADLLPPPTSLWEVQEENVEEEGFSTHFAPKTSHRGKPPSYEYAPQLVSAADAVAYQLAQRQHHFYPPTMMIHHHPNHAITEDFSSTLY